MDDIDFAQKHDMDNTALACKVRKPEGPAPTGQCLACGSPLPGVGRWCDAECRDDWEIAQRLG